MEALRSKIGEGGSGYAEKNEPAILLHFFLSVSQPIIIFSDLLDFLMIRRTLGTKPG